MTALSVGAQLAAGTPLLALVHIHAGDIVSVHLVAGLTEALGSPRGHDTPGVTGEVGAVAAPRTPGALIALVPTLADVITYVTRLQTH